MVSESKPKSSKYIIHFHGEARYIAIGDGARVELSPPPGGVPFQAPPLPAHFVPRPEASNALKARLLADGPAAPGVLVVSAIHGLGGIGKSTIAAALAYDRDVQERFVDGVLWVTLGQQPELLPLLSGWIQALGDYSFHPTTVNMSSAHLRTLLQDKAALLVVDDVWDPGHVRHFLVGGADCQVLITTRRADVADEVGAGLHQLNVMTPVQSLALLSQRLGRELQGKEQKDALALAKTIGHLPLALELAAARVARGTSWTALLEALTEEIAQLEALEGPRRGHSKRHLRLEASFSLSLNAIRLDDEKTWEAFIWLGVLPEDATLAAPMAATLWNMPQDEAGEILELLWNDALLLPGSAQWIRERTWPTYRLHDLIHDLARRLLTGAEPNGRGFTLSEAHAVLLQHYRVQTSGGLWHTLPEDGYVHEHLTWHMEQAGQADQLHALLGEETPEGQNGWYEARERLGQTAGYLADIRRAWQLADEAGEHNPIAVTHQMRYALIEASLHTLAGNIPTALLVALVEHKMPGWTAAAALGYAQQIPDEYRRAEALAALARCLPAELLTEALAAAQAIEDEYTRTDTLICLIPYLPAATLHECLTAARAMKWQECRAKVLVALAPYLPAELLAETLAAARAIHWETGRAQALGALAPRFPTELQRQVLAEALAAACDIEQEDARAETLGALAVQLPAELQPQAVDAACATKEQDARAKALGALAPHLPDELLTEGLAACDIGRESLSGEALIGLAPHLPDELLLEALAAARAIPGTYTRAEVLSHLALRLSAELQREVLAETLAITRTIESEYVRAQVLSRLGHHLSAGLRRQVLTEALVAALGIKEPHSRVRVLASLAHDLPTDLRQQALAGALAAIPSVPETSFLLPDVPSPRAEALEHLACYLPANLLAEALDIARAIKWKDGSADALARLAPYLPAKQRRGVLAEALVIVRSIKGAEDDHAEALIALTAYHLPLDLQAQILAVVRAIEWRGSRARAMVALAPHLPIGLRWQVRSEAVDNASRIHDREMRIDALVALAPDLPASLKEKALTKALDSVPGISDLEERVVALGKLAPCLPPGLQPRAVAIACAIDDNSARVRALLSLISCLPPGLRGQAASVALDTIRRLPETGRYTSGNPRAEALSYLAPHLPTESLIEALADARSIVNDMARARVLAALTPFLPASLQAQAVAEALDTVRPTGSEGILVQVLCTLAPYVPADRQQKILIEALTAAFAIKDPSSRVEVLTGLASHLSGKLKQQAVTEALAAVRAIRWEETRVEALVGLAPHLTAELLTKALSIARTTRHAGARAEALGRVIPYLQTDHRQQVLAEALAVVTRAERWSEGRSRALAILTNIWAAWAKEARPAAYSLWPEILHALANCSRQNLLADLRALVPVVFALGGTEAAEETARAILDVKRWWP